MARKGTVSPALPRSIARWGLLAAVLLGIVLTASGCGGSPEARKAEHISNGWQFMAERNYAKARIEFRNALQIDPKDANSRALVGLSNEKMGEYKDAVNAYRLALEVDGTLEMPRSRLAIIYASAGLTEEALELAEDGLATSPESPMLLTARAVATASMDLPAARRDAENAVRLDPKNPDAVGVLASLMWRENQRDEAIALLQKAVLDVPAEIDLRTSLARLLLAEERAADAEQQLSETIRLEPGRIENRFALAQVYLAQGKLDAAIATVREAVAAHPDNVDAKLALAQLLVEHRSFEEGEKQLLDFASAAERDLDLQLGVGRFYEANRREQPAAEAYGKVIENAGDRPQGIVARNRLARMALANGEVDEASTYVAEVLQRSGNDGDALAIRAEIAMRRSDPASAINDLRVAYSMQPDSVPLAAALARAYIKSGSEDLAEQTLRSLVRANPGDLQALFALSQFLIEAGKADEAQPVLENLVAEQPNNALALEGLARVQIASGDSKAALESAMQLQSARPKSAAGYELAGAALENTQRLKEARTAFERAAELAPTSVEPVLSLVRLDIVERLPEQAISRLKRAEERFPQEPRLKVVRGDVLTSMGRLPEAIETYEEAIEIAPTWPQAYRGLAGAYERAGEQARALRTLEEGFAATQKSTPVGIDLALAYGRQGRIDDAVAVYEELLSLRPDNSVAANNLAMLLVSARGDEGSLERAERLVKPLASLKNPAYMDTYGLLLLKRGRYAEAIEVLTVATSLAPRAAEIRYHLGLAQLEADRPEDAQRSLESALALQSDFPGADDARARLEKM